MKIAPLLLAATLFILAVPAVRHWREEPPAPPPAIRLSFPAPPEAAHGNGDEALDAAISPDESEVVFVGTGLRQGGSGGQAGGPARGVPRLWRRALDAERAEPIAGTDGAQQPAWKQTGNVLSFFAGGRLKQISLPDGAIADLGEAPAPAGATWLRDGSLLFAPGAPGPIRRLLDGRVTDATALAPGDVTHAFPAAAGSSDAFVYLAVRDDGRRVARVQSTAGDAAARDLTTTSSHAMLSGDILLYVRDGVLLASRLNPETGAPIGRAMPIALDVGVTPAGRGLFTASPGLLLSAPAAPRRQDLVWLDASGTRAGAVSDAGDYWQVRLSPDDRLAAVTALDPLLRALDVLIVPTDGAGDAERLTLALAADSDPVWSPDGTRVLFRSMQSGTPGLFVRRVRQAGAAAEPMLQSELDETPTDWAGADVLVHARGSTSVDVLRLRTGTGAYEAVADTPFNEREARWAPDRRWIAYVSDESGQPDVYARRPDGTRVRVSLAGGTRPRWTRDGAGIVFVRGSQVMRADRAAGDPARFTPPRALFEAAGLRDFDVAHRTDRFLAILPANGGADVTVSAVLNWRSLLGTR